MMVGSGLGQVDPRVVAVRAQLEGQRRVEVQRLREVFQARLQQLREEYQGQVRELSERYRRQLGE